MKKPLGLDKKFKVRKKSDFLKLRRNSKKFVARHWIVFFQANELGYPRLAMSVSTSFGNAVIRNHFRRWVREQFRLNRPILPPIDIHFMAKRKCPDLTKTAFRKELNEDLKRFLHWLS